MVDSGKNSATNIERKHGHQNQMALQIFETSCILSYNENFYFAMKRFILF